ncbi:unnamed protein product [Schistosoma rodhaini]|uniref:C2H2-type domain-containing protein n=1 Tax=Schistosoma rodhaini TaxID=6188 RepID=A0AA85GFY7_9TREM|nr:unnamed protein product [Schistosoma rodhaini]
MLHRPTLMPPSMRSSSKFKLSTNSQHSSQSIKIENCLDFNGGETVIVGPTDPDEDRMKQEDTTYDVVLKKEQEDYMEEDYNENDEDMNSNETHMKSESHIPVSNIKLDEPTGNETAVTVTTDSVKPIEILPLNDAIQNLLTCIPHGAATIQNVPLQPILSSKVNGSGSVQMPNVVSNALPTLWLHSPVVNSTGMSMPNVTSVTDLTSNIVQNTANALNPLVAAVLVNCATVNMISQLAGSMCTPIVNSSVMDGNVNGINVNNNNNHTTINGSVSSGNVGVGCGGVVVGINGGVTGVNTVIIPTASLLPNLLSAIPLSTYISGLGLTTSGGIITSPNNLCDVGVTSTVVSSAKTLNANNNNNNGIIVTPLNVENITISPSSGRNQAERNDVMYSTEISVVNNSSNEIVKNTKNNNDNNVTTISSESFQPYMIIPDSRTMFSTVPAKELRKYHCTYPGCEKSYTRRFQLNQHILTHIITGPISCDAPNCSMKYFSEEDLKRHKLCKHSSANKDSRHQQACTIPECDGSYSEKHSEITTFSSNVLPESTEPVETRNATSITPNIQKNRTLPLIAPKSTISLPTNLIFRNVCTYPGCGKSYSSYTKLKLHLRSHKCEKYYVCRKPGCNATFTQLSGVRSHELSHISIHKGSERLDQYPITISDNIFRTSLDTSQLKLISQSNAEITNISPDVLLKSTEPMEITSEISIAPNIHENRSLPLVVPNSSVPLPEPFILTASWDSEMKLLYVCPFKECGKAFTKRSKLHEHVCRHMGVRPFVCDKCKASFVQKYELRRHSIIHLRGAQPRSLSRFLTTPQQTNETLESIIANSQIPVSTTPNTTPITTTYATYTTNTIPTVTTPVSATSLISDATNPTISTVPVSISTLKVEEEPVLIKMEGVTEQSTNVRPYDTDDQNSTHKLLYTLLQSNCETLQSS